jgi:hypothetical protein
MSGRTPNEFSIRLRNILCLKDFLPSLSNSEGSTTSGGHCLIINPDETAPLTVVGLSSDTNNQEMPEEVGKSNF